MNYRVHKIVDDVAHFNTVYIHTLLICFMNGRLQKNIIYGASSVSEMSGQNIILFLISPILAF